MTGTGNAMAEEIFDNPTDWVAKHIRRYVESNGEKGHRAYGHDSLLLTTRGSRTGKLRRTALWYLRDGDRYVLCAPTRQWLSRSARTRSLRSRESRARRNVPRFGTE